MRPSVATMLVAVVVLAGCAGTPGGGPEADDLAGGGTTADPAGTTTAEETTADANTAAESSEPTTRANGENATAESTGESHGQRPGTLAVTVEAVASADTAVVRHGNDSLDRLRLLGVDAPPVHRPADPTAYEGVPNTREAERCLGAVAEGGHGSLADRIEDESIEVALPATGATRDAAGRLLGHPIHDGERLDRLLVRDGFARVADGEFADRDDLLALQAAARETDAGVWACSAVDWDYGSDSPLSIAEVDPDAERLVIRNTGDSRVDLSGWSVSDADDGLDYDFPDGFRLAAGQSVTLHTGDGDDRGGHLYWGLHREAWEDEGDAVYIRRSDGSVAVRYEYGDGSR